jgi:hypothetical protein
VQVEEGKGGAIRGDTRETRGRVRENGGIAWSGEEYAESTRFEGKAQVERQSARMCVKSRERSRSFMRLE